MGLGGGGRSGNRRSGGKSSGGGRRRGPSQSGGDSGDGHQQKGGGGGGLAPQPKMFILAKRPTNNNNSSSSNNNSHSNSSADPSGDTSSSSSSGVTQVGISTSSGLISREPTGPTSASGEGISGLTASTASTASTVTQGTAALAETAENRQKSPVAVRTLMQPPRKSSGGQGAGGNEVVNPSAVILAKPVQNGGAGGGADSREVIGSKGGMIHRQTAQAFPAGIAVRPKHGNANQQHSSAKASPLPPAEIRRVVDACQRAELDSIRNWKCNVRVPFLDPLLLSLAPVELLTEVFPAQATVGGDSRESSPAPGGAPLSHSFGGMTVAGSNLPAGGADYVPMGSVPTVVAGQSGSANGSLVHQPAPPAPFTVVGVLGLEGSGKSTIANLLLHGADYAGGTVTSPMDLASSQDFPLSHRFGDCTRGVNLACSRDGVMVLDAQAMISGALTADLARARLGQVAQYGFDPAAAAASGLALGPVARDHSGSLPPEMAHLLHSLEVALFLFSVCNVVVVAADARSAAENSRLWDFLHTVALLKSRIADVSMLALGITQPGKGEREFLPHVVVALNHTPARDFHGDNAKRIVETLDSVLPREFLSAVPLQPSALPARESGTSAVSLSASFTLLPVAGGSTVAENHREEDSNDVRPQLTSSSSSFAENQVDAPSDFVYVPFSAAAAELRSGVLSRKQRFARTISARDWLRATSKTWEHIGRSRSVMEYVRALQRGLNPGKS